MTHPIPTTSPEADSGGTPLAHAVRRPTLRKWHRSVLTALTTASVLAFLAAPPASADTAGGAGRVDQRTYQATTGVNTYLVYVPQGWKETDRLPLYVMLHGCGTTADQQMHISLLNSLADSERFIVAYPDNGGQCWRAVSNDKASVTRGGGGDADIVAGITREVISNYHVDSERVYLAGFSSGAFQTSATGAAYPDLYAAIGISAGAGYGMDILSCLTMSDSDAPKYAPQAVTQMGSRARVMPFFTIGGTFDAIGENPTLGGCTRRAYIAWLATDNLLKPGTNGDTFRDDPASTTTGQVPGGFTWTRKMARDTSGCQISERWIVDTMGHDWSGGTTAPQGPSASQASWRFFKKFTLHGGNTTCHT
jgi:poly(3-hydroxybutyrate) depolymerase